METYNKSILKYRDVRSAVELAQERYFEKGILQGIEKGIKKGFEQGIEKGIRQGFEKGIERGIEKSIKTTAIKCLEEGMPVEFVCRVTGLSPEQIKQIRS